ncbi:RPII140-upstream protein-like [Tropilaelaps mercedesae]|uniref:Complex I assembly factor TIMMDC1, mitochondrial n=1 Tax=Tropilaelaps mercedesae TaxID=418985 RepID=A0A1V9XVJ1_9ACAR|nr:RPII140-upstream protein-like [Tropilaelaps mercedesae]
MDVATKPRDVASEIDVDIKLQQHGVTLKPRSPDETGWDRLREMYTYKGGRYSPELLLVGECLVLPIVTLSRYLDACAALRTRGGRDVNLRMLTFMWTISFDVLSGNTAALGGMLGVVSGGLNYARFSREEFIRANKHNKFMNANEYMRRFTDNQILAMMRGGLRFGWRVALFTGIYALGTVSGSVYRGKFGIAEHIVSGALAAGIYRCHIGLRGMMSGSLLGATFGMLGGITTVMFTKIMGVTLTQVRIETYKSYLKIWEEEERKKVSEMAAKILQEHNKELGDPPV